MITIRYRDVLPLSRAAHLPWAWHVVAATGTRYPYYGRLTCLGRGTWLLLPFRASYSFYMPFSCRLERGLAFALAWCGALSQPVPEHSVAR